MSKWTKWRDRALRKIADLLGLSKGSASAAPAAGESSAGSEFCLAGLAVPEWDKCTRASCWGGTNASVRIMNCLSPKMPESVFKERVAWTKARGANTIHLFLVNKGDGEYSGYSPWGVGKKPNAGETDAATVRTMRERLYYCYKQGLAVVIWLQADDSSDWAAALASNADRCVTRIVEAGLFGVASTVVAGLEMNEYWNATHARAVVSAIRAHYHYKVGTHHTGGRTTFASLGDILFYQVEPGRSAAQIKADTKSALKTGKPVNFFELSRGPARDLCEAALSAGAFGVGNW